MTINKMKILILFLLIILMGSGYYNYQSAQKVSDENRIYRGATQVFMTKGGYFDKINN